MVLHVTTANWSNLLLEWFEDEGETYPFRWLRDPYRILVTEMLLCQTTAHQVASIYSRFFSQFPRLSTLARAPKRDIEQCIRPLGMKKRAAILKKVAGQIVAKFHGRIPRDRATLMSFPGVGNYVSGCVLTFGFDRPVPLIDVNTRRILSRMSNLQLDSKETARVLDGKYDSAAPSGKKREFHYALIDLAHKICKHENPRCDICPLSPYCDYSHRVLLRNKVGVRSTLRA